jgi:hypothetical protein
MHITRRPKLNEATTTEAVLILSAVNVLLNVRDT